MITNAVQRGTVGLRNGLKGLFEVFDFSLTWWAVLDLNQ